MSTTSERRLYAIADLPILLKLSQEKVQDLIRTGQLKSVRICGEVRFDSKEIEALIETYSQVANRRGSQ